MSKKLTPAQIKLLNKIWEHDPGKTFWPCYGRDSAGKSIIKDKTFVTLRDEGFIVCPHDAGNRMRIFLTMKAILFLHGESVDEAHPSPEQEKGIDLSSGDDVWVRYIANRKGRT